MSEATILEGDVLEQLATLPEASVSCVVTSPPYWCLRRYDAPEVVWGGDAECEHEWGTDASQLGRSDSGYSSQKRWQHEEVSREATPEAWGGTYNTGSTCSLCGAWRGQYGLEATPELYVEHTIMVFRAIRRVLRDDGVVWWNVGDGYAATKRSTIVSGLKPKDLVLMPFRVALAAQADGWWVRSDIIWSKPNAMPESTKDRPTKAHEYIFMLTKKARYFYDAEAVRYFYDAEAVRESATGQNHHDLTGQGYRVPGQTEQAGNRKHSGNKERKLGVGGIDDHRGSSIPWEAPPHGGRNLRTVWEFPTAQTPEAHFATFPEELPRRCIEASCPREICAKCGEARVRVMERTDVVDERARGSRFAEGKTGINGEGRAQEGERFLSESTGWTSCGCEQPDYRPGTVLDPFCGTGTTGLVARRLGRKFVGIELSPQYAEMAREKLRYWWRRTKLVEAEVPEGQAVMPLEAGRNA